MPLRKRDCASGTAQVGMCKREEADGEERQRAGCLCCFLRDISSRRLSFSCFICGAIPHACPRCRPDQPGDHVRRRKGRKKVRLALKPCWRALTFGTCRLMRTLFAAAMSSCRRKPTVRRTAGAAEAIVPQQSRCRMGWGARVRRVQRSVWDGTRAAAT